MDIILIRHGQSHANQAGLLIANSEDGLTALGVEQSVALDATLRKFGVRANAYFVSPWKRALETAQIIFPQVVHDFNIDPRLAETNPGRFGTWLEKDFNDAYPDFYSDMDARYDGGESHLDMARRVHDWISSEVLKSPGEAGVICVVAHGGPISIILQTLLSIPLEARYPSFSVPNASFSMLRWRADKSRFVAERIGQT
jgi:glucosyl-3-phosphoglycerate phosphatase